MRARIRPAAQHRGFTLAMAVEEEVTAERPLVFDFGLLEGEAAGDVAASLVSNGPRPRTDAIVQIGAMRALNGRLVRGETFETPGRPRCAVTADCCRTSTPDRRLRRRAAALG